jgi:hypothetical protein
MAVGNFSFISVLFALVSGGANDALDFVSTEAYWKTKTVAVSVEAMAAELKPVPAADVGEHVRKLGSDNDAVRQEASRKILAVGPAALPDLEKAADDPDVETASRASNLAQQIRQGSKGAQMRRLMAIRTLGELKKVEGLPALRPLLVSKEMFVADYAARAVATIEGKPLPPRPVDAAALKADLSLFPTNVGAVGQVVVGSDRPVDLDKLLKDVPPQPGEDRQKALDQMQPALISTLEQVGNVRIEAVTFAVADTIGHREGFAAAVVRVKYDAKAVANLVRPILNKTEAVEGAEVFVPTDEIAFAFPSDDRFVAITGAKREQLPVKELLTAIRDNRGPLLTNKDLAALIAAVDPKAKAWAVCKVSDSYRAAPVLAAFDTLTVTGVPDGDTLNLKVAGAGKDAAAVKDAVNQVAGGVAQLQQEAPKMAERMPPLKPMADFAESIKTEAAGNQATLTASFKGDTTALLGLPMVMFGARSVEVHHAPPPAPVKDQ